MSILDILEAHQGTAALFCAACPDYRPAQEELDAVQTIDDDRRLALRHVAQVLERHEQEAKAEALEEAARSTPVRWDFPPHASALEIRPWLRGRAAQIRKESKTE